MNQANGGNVIFKFLGDDKDLKGKVEEVKGTLSKFGGVAKVLGATVAAGTMAATGAVAALTKKSVDAYAEMEQLAGGAKKIFDEMDYSKIEEDAKSAYRTMNLSASQYLALINDVGATFAATMGDQRGYDAAKQGLQAISDYATGTGKNVDLLGQKFTMITRATSTYQSIADQFAGVLPATSKDFLEQAQAAGLLSEEYQKLTDVPIDEYQQAVSGMLELGVKNLGLANNTLAESTQTITGSVAAAKSAIQNFLSGTGSINEVIETVKTAGVQISKGITEMLPQVVEGVVGIINGLIPELPGLINSLLPALMNGVITLIEGLLNAMPTFLEVLVGMIPQLVNTLVDVFVKVLTAVGEQAPTIVPIIVEALIDGIIALFENADVIIGACLALIVGLTEGIINSLPVLIEKIPFIITSIMFALRDAAPMLIESGINLIVAIIKGLQSMPGALLNAGINLIKGIWEGIKNFDIVGKIKDLAKSMLNGMKKILGIHSPSTEFAWLGKMSMEGYADSIEDMKGMLDNVIEDTFSLSPQLSNAGLHYSPNVIVNNNIEANTDPLGQTVMQIKTFANGAKNDYNYGMGV